LIFLPPSFSTSPSISTKVCQCGDSFAKCFFTPWTLSTCSPYICSPKVPPRSFPTEDALFFHEDGSLFSPPVGRRIRQYPSVPSYHIYFLFFDPPFFLFPLTIPTSCLFPPFESRHHGSWFISANPSMGLEWLLRCTFLPDNFLPGMFRMVRRIHW